MEQDWKPVVFKKKIEQTPVQKATAIKNKKRGNNSAQKLCKVDNTEIDTIKKVSMSTSKAISKRRTELGLKQKDLANRINVKIELLASYENGKAVPNGQIINKLERVLGVYLTGKKVGEVKEKRCKN